ncbi:hypothetical protein RB7547 [Rhodopirellula baltica SH 1]|uniref:Uncharacterized protein n=1 Tax=Rhodopirellula baltica (strain DSM 10527 / NCIMB 13988 / SH1) TaxID=243090 RepID=Q7UNJ6_RHOBA|nr:hypothetical protein RB7547 [Rhodopirellula baltica SH 1]
MNCTDRIVFGPFDERLGSSSHHTFPSQKRSQHCERIAWQLHRLSGSRRNRAPRQYKRPLVLRNRDSHHD